MRPRDTQLRDREPLPAMLAGDGAAAAPVPAALVLPHEHEIAALLPDDLRVVVEGTSPSRLLLIAVGVLAGLILELDWMGGMYNLEGQVLLIGGPWAFVAWLLHRDLVRRRREFRLTDTGITVEVTPFVFGDPRVTHIPWAEIAEYTVSVDYEKAYLRVVSARGYTLTLNDRPPRLSTRELIRRFVEQADRHPRAAEPTPRRKGAPLPDVTGERPPILVGCLTLFALVLLNSAIEVFLEPSSAQKLTGFAVLGAIGLGVHLWWTLDDDDIAQSDRDSRRLMARLRGWLRRVLGIPSPPAMFVGDEEPAARVPEPPPVGHPFLAPPPEAATSRLRAFFALPPDRSEEPSPAQPASDVDESASGIPDVTGERESTRGG